MSEFERKVNLVLIANRPNRACMIRDLMQRAGINGVIRRLPPGTGAVNCARQSGAYRDRPLPDLIVFDFANPDEHATAILRKIAFGSDKSSVPVILLTSSRSQALLDAGEVDAGEAVMFAPTGLASFIGKMRNGNRDVFFKALRTLYKFGPILVRTPTAILIQDVREMSMSA